SHAVLPGATITVKNVETGATRTLVSDAAGHYRALSLPPGLYAVSAELQGFTSASRGNLTVEIGRDIVADLSMKVGAITEQMTGYLLEGTNISDISDKAPSSMAGVLLGVDAVKEFSVQTHDYSAEFGRAAGGVISAVTKSGTNSLHGTLFEFMRDSSMDARNFFDPQNGAPPFMRNQFGGTAGGPIVKN